MITLPTSPSRAWLFSFWCALSLSAGVLVGVLSWALSLSVLFGAGVIIIIMLALVAGLLQPQLFSKPYKLWNGMASKFARFAELWLIGVCFYMIFPTVGRTGSSLRITRPNSNTKSLWTPRGTLATSAYFSQYGTTTEETTQRGWISTFLFRTVQSGNIWACCLLPFLILLKTLEVEEDSGFPTNIYTLY